MANFLYVDNSNVWIEGMHVAAVHHGLAPNIISAQEQRICDRSWNIDFGRLLEFAGGTRSEIGRAVLYGSKPPANDTLWNMAEKAGFAVVTHDRNQYTGREKKIDTNIVTDIITDSFQLMQSGRDEITLVAGDKDYIPAIESLKGRGFKFYVCFWDHAASEMRSTATEFISLNAHLEHLCYHKHR